RRSHAGCWLLAAGYGNHLRQPQSFHSAIHWRLGTGNWTLGSVDFRFRNRCRAFKKIEVASAIGLGDVKGIHLSEPAGILRLGLFPLSATTGEFRVVSTNREPSLRYVQLD